MRGLLLLVVSTGCTPLHHSIAPYESDPVEARAIEARANGHCGAMRAGGPLPPYAFTTDGCSAWPDGDWVRCCVEHDFAYWCGGSAEQRQAADAEFRECLIGAGHDTLATWMYYGVRFGGHPWWPFPWRWGYGWDWPYR